MTKEQFSSTVRSLQEFYVAEKTLSTVGVSIIELVTPLESAIYSLLGAIFDEDGVDVFYWFCYDNKFGAAGLSLSWEGKEYGDSINNIYEYLTENHLLCEHYS